MAQHRFLYFLVLAIILGGIVVYQLSPSPALADTLQADQPDQQQEEVDNCLACHTDKDALVSTAKAEDAVESENEGEG